MGWLCPTVSAPLNDSFSVHYESCFLMHPLLMIEPLLPPRRRGNRSHSLSVQARRPWYWHHAAWLSHEQL